MNTMSKNRKALLDTIAYSELGSWILTHSDDGYNVLVGSTPNNIMLFNGYSDHPNKLVHIRTGLDSTAAGRYQLLHKFYVAYCQLLGLHDFSKDSQDQIALQQLKEKGALACIDQGNFAGAIAKANTIWASLPGSPYNQHTNSYDELLVVYQMYGGTLN